MAQSACVSCGAQIFLGEAKCTSCGAPTPADVASFGRDVEAGGPMPPPEGLGLIVQKQLADNEARDRNRERAEGGRWRFGMDEDDAMATGRSMGSMAKVERDGAGNVVWDPKYAIIGGIVVAIFVGIVAAWIYAQVKTGASSFTPPTSLR